MAAEPTSVEPLCNPCAISVRDLIRAAREAGLTYRVEGDRLSVKGPKPSAELGRQLIDRKAEVLAYLATWDQSEALRLMGLADGEVERNGCYGLHPDVQAAAVKVCDAFRVGDMIGVARWCDEVVKSARSLSPAA